MALNAINLKSKRFDDYVKVLSISFINNRVNALIDLEDRLSKDDKRYKAVFGTNLCFYLKNNTFNSMEGLVSGEKLILDIYRTQYAKLKEEIHSEHPDWNFTGMPIEEIQDKIIYYSIHFRSVVKEMYPLEDCIEEYNYDQKLQDLKTGLCLSSNVADLLSGDAPFDCSLKINSINCMDDGGVGDLFLDLYSDKEEVDALYNSICMMEPRKLGDPVKVALLSKEFGQKYNKEIIYDLLGIKNESYPSFAIEVKEYSYQEEKNNLVFLDTPPYATSDRFTYAQRPGMPEYNYISKYFLSENKNFDIAVLMLEGITVPCDRKILAALMKANKPVLIVVPNIYDYRKFCEGYINELDREFYTHVMEMTQYGFTEDQLSDFKIFYLYPSAFEYQIDEQFQKGRISEEVRDCFKKTREQGLEGPEGLRTVIVREADKIMAEDKSLEDKMHLRNDLNSIIRRYNFGFDKIRESMQPQQEEPAAILSSGQAIASVVTPSHSNVSQRRNLVLVGTNLLQTNQVISHGITNQRSS